MLEALGVSSEVVSVSLEVGDGFMVGWLVMGFNGVFFLKSLGKNALFVVASFNGIRAH